MSAVRQGEKGEYSRQLLIALQGMRQILRMGKLYGRADLDQHGMTGRTRWLKSTKTTPRTVAMMM